MIEQSMVKTFRKKISSKLLPDVDPFGNIEYIFFEINLRFSGFYNPIFLRQKLIFIHPSMKTLMNLMLKWQIDI